MPNAFQDIDPLKQRLADEAARKAASSGGTFDGIVNGGEIVGDLVTAAVSSVDVAGAVFETNHCRNAKQHCSRAG